MKEGILLGDSSMNHVLRLRELSSVRHCHPPPPPSPSPTSEPLDLTAKDKCLETKPQLSDRTLRAKMGKCLRPALLLPGLGLKVVLLSPVALSLLISTLGYQSQ